MKLRISQAFVLCSIILFLQGCLISLATIGVIAYVRGEDHHTATVRLEATPDNIYASMVSRLEGQPDVAIIKQDQSDWMVEATKGELRVTAKITDIGNQISELMITADAGTSKMSDEELALRVVKQICSDLAVDCETTYQ